MRLVQDSDSRYRPCGLEVRACNRDWTIGDVGRHGEEDPEHNIAGLRCSTIASATITIHEQGRG